MMRSKTWPPITWPYYIVESFDKLSVVFNETEVFSLPRDRTLGGGDTKNYMYAKEHIELLMQHAQTCNAFHVSIDINVEGNQITSTFPHNWASVGDNGGPTYGKGETLATSLKNLANNLEKENVFSGEAKNMGGAIG